MISESVKINELMGKGKSEIMKWWDDDDMAFEAQQWSQCLKITRNVLLYSELLIRSFTPRALIN